MSQQETVSHYEHHCQLCDYYPCKESTNRKIRQRPICWQFKNTRHPCFGRYMFNAFICTPCTLTRECQNQTLGGGETPEMTMNKHKPVNYYPDKQSILLKGKTWNLWLNRVQTHDTPPRTLFPLKLNEVTYDRETHNFNYKPIKEDPIWFTRHDLLELADYLKTLAENAEQTSREQAKL